MPTLLRYDARTPVVQEAAHGSLEKAWAAMVVGWRGAEPHANNTAGGRGADARPRETRLQQEDMGRTLKKTAGSPGTPGGIWKNVKIELRNKQDKEKGQCAVQVKEMLHVKCFSEQHKDSEDIREWKEMELYDSIPVLSLHPNSTPYISHLHAHYKFYFSLVHVLSGNKYFWAPTVCQVPW